MDNLIFSKLICIFLFLLVSSFGCSIPYLIELYNKTYNKKSEKDLNNILSHLNCFGSGFIFAIALFHLLPESILCIINHEEVYFFNKDNINLEVLFVFSFVFLGFLIQLTLEYVCPSNKHICCVLHDTDKKYNLDISIYDTNNEISKTVTDNEQHTISITDNKLKLKKFLKFLHALTVQSFFLTISLAIHSIIEGMVVGTTNNVNYVFINSLCILAHKWIAGITISISINQNNLHHYIKNFLIIFFIISSPIGIILGSIVQSAGPKTTIIINSISIGTLLLIGCEILFNELNEKYSRKHRFTKWLCFVSSCAFTFILVLLTIKYAIHVH